jgi:hypothetical protein
VRDGDVRGGAVQRGTSRPQRHAPGTATSHSCPPAPPTPLARARGLTRVAPSIGPTREERRHQRRHPPPRVLGGSALRTNLLAPLGRGTRDQCLRRRRRRLFLLRRRGRGRNARRLTHRGRARRCARRHLQTPPCHHGHPQLKCLGRREGGDGRRNPVSKKAKK